VSPQYSIAWSDFRDDIRSWHMWSRLGWSDVKGRYRRTVFGPFWATLSLGIFIVAVSFIWARLWNAKLETFLPFVTAGMLAWTLIVSLIQDGASIFLTSGGLIRSLSFPYTTLTCSLVWRHMILFAHNLLIYVFVVPLMGVPVTWQMLLFVPALLLVALNSIWVATLLGLLSARFRDIPLLIQTILNVLMFITPIFWTYDQLKGRTGQILINGNVILHFVEILRMPMLGRLPELYTIEVVLVTTVLGWLVTVFCFARFRRRLPYWL
jgi:ABC-type polysaccharide/polyol phosphate export permease